MYGGIDALIWLCRTSTSIQIHHLTTTILAMLSERGKRMIYALMRWSIMILNVYFLSTEAVRPVMVTKWALPSLLHLIEHNIYHDQNKNKTNGIQQQQQQQQREMALEIVINCIHVFFHMARAGILTYSVVMEDGILATLVMLSGFEPPRGTEDVEEDQNRLMERGDIIQALAAKTLSAVSGQGLYARKEWSLYILLGDLTTPTIVAFQAGMIEWVHNNDKFASLFRSTNGEVRKYMTKSIAYLSLRNGKFYLSCWKG